MTVEDRTEDANYVAVQALVTYPLVERLRCVRLATGQLVYEFWTDKSAQVARVDANAYEYALDVARDNVQDEEIPKGVAAAKVTGSRAADA